MTFWGMKTFCSSKLFCLLCSLIAHEVMDFFFCSALLCVTLEKGKNKITPKDPNLEFETDELFSLLPLQRFICVSFYLLAWNWSSLAGRRIDDQAAIGRVRISCVWAVSDCKRRPMQRTPLNGQIMEKFSYLEKAQRWRQMQKRSLFSFFA